MATPIVPPQKRCTKCGDEYPATAECFRPDRRQRSGLRPNCRVCDRAYSNQRRRDNPEKQREACRNWRTNNKSHVQQYNNEYNERNVIRLRHNRQQKYAANSQLEREKSRQYAADHREERRQYRRDWSVKNIEKVRVATRNRHARKRAAEGTHTAADIAAQYKRQKGRCYYAACGHVELDDKYHVDHVIPLTRGGRNDPSNLVLACPSCNLSKYNKLPHEWLEGGRLI